MTKFKSIIRSIGLLFITFLMTFSFLYIAGLVPEEARNFVSAVFEYNKAKAEVIELPEISFGQNGQGESPVYIEIPKISRASAIITPEKRDVKTLDEALLKGIVKYPGSADLGALGTTFLFGHSTSKQNVKNPAYKALNGLGNLALGDTIEVRSRQSIFTYKVIRVELAHKDKALVEFKTNGASLVLSTCNTFGKKEERFVVEAKLASKKTIKQ